MEALADIGFGVVVAMGLIAVCSVVALGEWTSPRARRHPEGRRGRIRDDLMVLGPMLPFLALVTIGAFQPALRDQTWWTAVLFTLAGLGLAANLLPAVRRARQRVSALYKGPAQ